MHRAALGNGNDCLFNPNLDIMIKYDNIDQFHAGQRYINNINKNLSLHSLIYVKNRGKYIMTRKKEELS